MIRNGYILCVIDYLELWLFIMGVNATGGFDFEGFPSDRASPKGYCCHAQNSPDFMKFATNNGLNRYNEYSLVFNCKLNKYLISMQEKTPIFLQLTFCDIFVLLIIRVYFSF